MENSSVNVEEKKTINTQDKEDKAIAPTCTLYIRKLNDKINVEEMRTCLYYMFSAYGEVIQVRMRDSQQLRGQAFIVFRDIKTATLALDQVNTSPQDAPQFTLFGERLEAHFSKQVSDETRRLGTGQNSHTNDYEVNQVVQERRKKRKVKEEQRRLLKRERMLNEEKKLLTKKQQVDAELQEAAKQKAIIEKQEAEARQIREKEQAELAQINAQKAQEAAEQAKTQTTGMATRVRSQQRTNVIKIENLPTDFSDSTIDELLKNYPGVDKVIETNNAQKWALVKFTSVDSAKFAVGGLNRFKVDQSGTELVVTYH